MKVICSGANECPRRHMHILCSHKNPHEYANNILGCSLPCSAVTCHVSCIEIKPKLPEPISPFQLEIVEVE